MNNILWLVNPATFQEKDFIFPAYISRLNNCPLTVLALEPAEIQALRLATNDVMFPTREYRIEGGDADFQQVQIQNGLDALKKTAADNGIDIQIRNATENLLENMMVESRFSDLILVSASLSFNPGDTTVPSDFVLEFLPKTQCPVLVMPDDLQEIKEIFFTYNGKYSAVYAIRQFTYLFPQLKDIPVTVLTVLESKEDIPYKEELKQLLYKHYNNITFKILSGDTESALLIELLPKKNAIVTFGAFGRSKLSRFFKRSGADNILHIINIPLFITHP
jgi:hypothetical protein